MSDKQSKEKIDILKAMGAEVHVCPTNVEADHPDSYYSVAKRYKKRTRTASGATNTTTCPTKKRITLPPVRKFGIKPKGASPTLLWA